MRLLATVQRLAARRVTAPILRCPYCGTSRRIEPRAYEFHLSVHRKLLGLSDPTGEWVEARIDWADRSQSH